MTNLTDAAHNYLSAGLQIIALTGKAPNNAFHKHGLTEPISGVPEGADDDALIERVFTHELSTGIGIVIPFPYLVVDVDGEAGAVSLKNLIGTSLPETPIAKTSRGLHIWFSDWVTRRSMPISEKLDLKSVGGYVVAPPSKHPDGSAYTWLDPLVEDGKLVVPLEIPDELRALLAGFERLVETEAREHVTTYLWQLELRNGEWRLHSEPTIADTDGLTKTIKGAPEGRRNRILYWATMRAIEDGVPLKTALDELGRAASDAGLTQRETRTTIRRAYQRSLQ